MFSNIFAICTKQLVFHVVSYEVPFSLMISVVNRCALTAVVAVFCFLNYLIAAVFKFFLVIHVSFFGCFKELCLLGIENRPQINMCFSQQLCF